MTKTLWPNGTETQPAHDHGSGRYGAARPAGRIHAGTDFLGYTDAKAVTGGKVTAAGWGNADTGNQVAIDLPELEDGCVVTIVRMHLETVAVVRGQVVDAGAFIGKVGDSGNAVGDCDHTEIRYWKGGKLVKTVDPVVWIAARIAAERAAAAAPAAPAIIKRTPRKNVNGRREPRTSSPVANVLKAGVAGEFNAEVQGEVVEGNGTWYRGAYTGLYFWAGAF